MLCSVYATQATFLIRARASRVWNVEWHNIGMRYISVRAKVDFLRFGMGTCQVTEFLCSIARGDGYFLESEDDTGRGSVQHSDGYGGGCNAEMVHSIERGYGKFESGDGTGHVTEVAYSIPIPSMLDQVTSFVPDQDPSSQIAVIWTGMFFSSLASGTISR